MRILLRYFTGTGNTGLCATFLADAFKEAGHVVDFAVGDASFDINQYDLIGLGYPIHAFNPPQIFLKQVKAMPEAKKDYFIFKVSGEPFWMNNSSSAWIASIMNKKGYHKIGEKHFLMPYNIIFRYKDPVMKQMYLYLPALTKAYVQDLLGGKAETIRYGLPSRVFAFLFRVEWIAPWVNAHLVFFRKKKCISCDKCLRDCPQQAIYKTDKGTLKINPNKCAMCMRCTLNCPVDAIRFGIMNPWKVTGGFNYPKLLQSEAIDPNYINANTKGYFRLFNKYFDRQRAMLKDHGIKDPVEAYRSR